MSRSGYVFTSRGVPQEIVVGILVRNRAFGSRIAEVIGQWGDYWILNTYANTALEWNAKANARSEAASQLYNEPIRYTFWLKSYYKHTWVKDKHFLTLTHKRSVTVGGLNPFMVHKLHAHVWQPVKQVKGPTKTEYNPEEMLM